MVKHRATLLVEAVNKTAKVPVTERLVQTITGVNHREKGHQFLQILVTRQTTRVEYREVIHLRRTEDRRKADLRAEDLREEDHREVDLRTADHQEVDHHHVVEDLREEDLQEEDHREVALQADMVPRRIPLLTEEDRREVDLRVHRRHRRLLLLEERHYLVMTNPCRMAISSSHQKDQITGAFTVWS